LTIDNKCGRQIVWDILPGVEVPQQENNYDCGVFVCRFAEYRSRDINFDFTQASMDAYRLFIKEKLLE
jgi:Ulp1 family protease